MLFEVSFSCDKNNLFTARLHVYQSTLIVLFITLTIMLSLLSDFQPIVSPVAL